LSIWQCLWDASNKPHHISMPSLFCILCWPHFNADDAENKYLFTRICSHDYHHTWSYYSHLKWPSDICYHEDSSLLWYSYSAFIELRHSKCLFFWDIQFCSSSHLKWPSDICYDEDSSLLWHSYSAFIEPRHSKCLIFWDIQFCSNIKMLLFPAL